MNFPPLNLPVPDFTLQKQNGKPYVFDVLRKKFVCLTPEEWVRQSFLHYLIFHLQYPQGLIALEAPIKLNDNKLRSDIVVFDKQGNPAMLVECKAAHVEISQQTFDQVIVYNMKLNAPYLIVTNGLKHFCFRQPTLGQEIEFFKNIPAYESINGVLD
jgi:hypothetical protein